MDAYKHASDVVPVASSEMAKDGTAQVDRPFERAWRAAYPALRLRAQHLARGQPDQAEDLLAAAAIKALLFMRRSPQKLTDPEMFLFVVLRHVFFDSVRQRARENRLFDWSAEIDSDACPVAAPGGHPTELWSEHHEQLRLVATSLQVMPPAQRRLFALRYLDELPYAAIAERLGIKEPLARKRAQLLRATLQCHARPQRFSHPRTCSV